MNSREIDPVIDIVGLEKVGAEDNHTGEVDEGDEVTVNFLCENAIGEIVIDEILLVKDKIGSELKMLELSEFLPSLRICVQVSQIENRL